MKKRLTFPVLFMISTALALGFANANVQSNYLRVDAATQLDSQITSVQIRSGGSGANYLVVLDSLIDPYGLSMDVSGTNYNAPNYINLYLSPTGNPVSLSTIINSSQNWGLNIWSSGGIMFPISDENFEIYNGCSVYAIEVLEGCTYPNANLATVRVGSTHKFVNQAYGNSANKNQSFYWNEVMPLTPSETVISVTNGQVRADPDNNFYDVCLVSDVYAGATVIDYPDLTEINAHSKIKLYLSENDSGEYLANITSLRKGAQNRWDSGAFLFELTAAEYEIYNGTTTYKIEIEAGCQLVLNNTIVTLDKAYTLINSNYGDVSCKNGAFYFMPETDTIPEVITLCDAQVRADVDNAFYFIDVRSDYYADRPVIFYDNLGDLNTYSHIKIYLSPQDEGTLLSNVTSLRNGYQNLWSSGAMLFALTAEEYESYNGTTIYKIEVLSGCQLFINNEVVTVDRAYTFINNDYGKASAKYEAFNFSQGAKELERFGSAELSSIHNRMDRDSNYRWIMFVFSEEIFNEYLDVTSWMDRINFLDNVLIYLEDGTNPISLRDIYDIDHGGVTLQMFASKTLMAVAISNERVGDKYLYAGPEMYRITIKENTQVPNIEDGEAGYRVIEKEISFINDDYGKYGAIPGEFDDDNQPRLYEEWSINWRVEVAGLVNLGEIGISTIHNRMDKDSSYRWLMIFLDSAIYDVSLDVSDWANKVNFLDKIFIYMTEEGEPLSLRDIYDPSTTGITLQLFSQRNMIAISITNEKEGSQYKYCGPNMFKIVMEEGAQFPTYEKGVAGFRTLRSKTVLVNDEYHLYGEIDDTMDDYGNPRLYEEWNTKWSLASCYVTFKVVGIEGISYPDMLLDYGQRVSLSKFAVDGYELKATTEEGDTIYECIIGTNHNMNVILTYSKLEGENKKEEKLTFWQKLRNFFRKLFGIKDKADTKSAITKKGE